MPRRDGWIYGKAVEDGVPRYLSVSQLEMADDCLRKWHYDKIMGKKGPETRATRRGTDTHAELETFLKTGERKFSSITLSGMFMVPEPIKYDEQGRPDMLVEQDMLLMPGDQIPFKPDQFETPEAVAWANAAIARAPLTADGIPVLGYMDLVHARGTNKGGTSVEDAYDPPGTIEVCDWKTTGNIDYIKKPRDLPKTIQMAGYASWVYRVEPAAHQVRLSHGVFVERGGPSRKVTLKVIRDDIQPTWEHAEGVARMIRQAAKETNPDIVDANTGSCEKFGGCPHKSYCNARMHKALASFIGPTAAAERLGKRTTDMGLLDKMKQQQTAETPALTAPITPASTPATSPAVNIGLGGILGIGAAAASTPAPDPAAERAKLEAEEAEQRAARALTEGANKIRPFIDKIEAYGTANAGLGAPPLAGDAARFFDAAFKNAPIRDKIEGVGKLAGIPAPLATIAELEALVGQLDALAAGGQVHPIAGPGALAGMPIPANVPATTAPAVETTPTVDAQPNVPAGTTTEKVEAKPEEKPAAKPSTKKTSPKKDESKTDPGDTFTLLVDCVHEGFGPSASIRPLLMELAAKLAASTGDADIQAAGVRQVEGGKLVASESPIGFGKWEGAYAAEIRAAEIPNGVHHLDTRGSRALEIAAMVLSERCQKTGGKFVWGRR